MLRARKRQAAAIMVVAVLESNVKSGNAGSDPGLTAEMHWVPITRGKHGTFTRYF